MKVILHADRTPNFAWEYVDENGGLYTLDDIDVIRRLMTEFNCGVKEIRFGDDGPYDFLLFHARVAQTSNDKLLTATFTEISDGGYQFLASRNGKVLFYRETPEQEQPSSSGVFSRLRGGH